MAKKNKLKVQQPTKSYMEFESVAKRSLNLIALQVPVEKILQTASPSAKMDLSDMARAAVVLAVAAMDAYFTDVFAERLVPYLRIKGATKPLVKLLEAAGLDAECALNLIAMERPYRRIRTLIESHLALKTTQKQNVIDELFAAYRLSQFSFNVEKLKKRKTLLKSINVLVNRRHKIAHEGDLNAHGRVQAIDPKQTRNRIKGHYNFCIGCGRDPSTSITSIEKELIMSEGQGQTTKQSITVRLSSQGEEVSAAAVATTLTAIVALITEAEEGIAANEQLLIKARPFSRGSFEIPLELVVFSPTKLLVVSPLIQQILHTLSKYFEAKIALRDVVETGSTESFSKTDLIIAPILRSLLSPTSYANAKVADAFREIDQDPDITDLDILRGVEKTSIVHISKQDFKYFLQTTIERIPSERQQTIRENLSIRSVAFEGSAKWKFNWRGNIISARIADSEFLERVRLGAEMFRAGDRLDVDLVTIQKFDETTQDYLYVAYEIVRVWNHETQSRQSKLFDE